MKNTKVAYRAQGFMLICAVICLFITGCAKEKLYPKEYVGWVEDEENGLKVRKQIGEYEFTVLYKPLEYIALMQEKDENIKKDTLDTRLKQLGDMQYYTLKIKSVSGKDVLSSGMTGDREYYQRLEYFASYMQQDLMLVDGADTLPCVLHHFERNYGIAPVISIVLGFEKPAADVQGNSSGDKLIIYNDAVLGTGPVRLAIKGSAIEEIPQLKTF